MQQTQLAVRAARETVEAADEALSSAMEPLRLVEGRYETSVGSGIELMDAQVAATSAGQQQVAASYALAQTRAQRLEVLER